MTEPQRSAAVLGDAEARAVARLIRTRAETWRDLAEASWRRSLAAAAAGQPGEALRWLERAYRMVPADGMVAAALAGALLQAREAARAAALFAPLARDMGMADAWAGLAAASRMLGDMQGALDAASAGLRCSVPTETLRALAGAIAADAGLPGWCGLDGDGWLHAGPARPGLVLLDGAPVTPFWAGRRGRLPPGWRGARLLEVPGHLGSPIPVGAITGVEGFVEVREGGLHGWAWHPADPLRRPAVTVDREGLHLDLTADVPADGVRLDRPMARPWAFQVPAVALAGVIGPVSVRGAGRDLLGSPLDPGMERRAAAAAALAVRDGTVGGGGWAGAFCLPDQARVPGPGQPGGAASAALAVRDGRVGLAGWTGAPRPPEPAGVSGPGQPGHGGDGAPLPDGAAWQPVQAGDAPLAGLASGHEPGPGGKAAASVRGLGRAARPPGVDVVIPCYRGLRLTLACIGSVLASVPRGTGVVVVDDASPEPELAAALDALHRRRRIRLIRHGENRGFPAAANAGLRACAGRDVLLLNSDTLVPPGWLGRLRAAAYSAPDIGTATPWSNEATILSYPAREGGNPVPDLAGVVAADALAQAANGGGTADLPTGVGFCLYLRRDCLDAVGLLREDVFAQGYGEENDLCLRARHLGWRSVAALGVYVGHAGGASFGAARRHLVARNMAVLNRLHPGYDALVQAHLQADPLRPARRGMDERRWAADRRPGDAVAAVTHNGGGGVERVVQDHAAAWAAAGQRPIVLRPAPGGCRVESPGGTYPNLAYALPDELPLLARLLRPDRVRRVELHHLLGHHHAVTGLARLLRAPQHVVVHDYAGFCPRIALVSTGRRYCGEPDVDGCEACVADLGTKLEEDIPVPALVARTAALLAGAAQVIAPSADAAARIRRHFPLVRPVVRPWEDDGALPPPELAPLPAPGGLVRHVCVVGALGVEKGYEVLLDCVRDARRRGLPLRFTVVGHTSDDERLLDAGPVSITGEYQEADAVALIRAQGAHLALLPSVWPETWCFALSRAWQAGLAVAAFDLGAQAERIRATGRGWLLPLGLHGAAVNDALLRLALPSPAQAGAAPPGATPPGAVPAACAVPQAVAMVPPPAPRRHADPSKRT